MFDRPSDERLPERFRSGAGNWSGFCLTFDEIYEAAEGWKKEVDVEEKYWLCWNVDPAWCLLQQKLVKAVGWTPLVGGDPRATRPELVDGAVWIDFNRCLKLPMMHMVFPVEFMYLFVNKLAFWHSDLLIRLEKIEQISGLFNQLADGDIAVTDPRRGIKDTILRRKDRYWELVGCTTRSASLDQFEKGAGWFKNIAQHPNAPAHEQVARSKIYYDHGAGVKYWVKNYLRPPASVKVIDEKFVDEGHFTRINNPGYKVVSPIDERDLTKELSLNFRIEDAAAKLGLESFL